MCMEHTGHKVSRIFFPKGHSGLYIAMKKTSGFELCISSLVIVLIELKPINLNVFSRVTVSCALPSTTNVTISTSISQTFRSSVTIFHHRHRMMFYLTAHTVWQGLLLLWMLYLRAARLSSKLLEHGYVIERLKSFLRKFYGRYGEFIKNYEVSLSEMLHDILGHVHIQWHTQLIRHYTNLRTYYRTGLYYRFLPYYQILEVSIEHCNGCGYPTEDAYSSRHLVLSHLGLSFVLMLRQFFAELVMSTELLSFEHPSVLLFCLI